MNMPMQKYVVGYLFSPDLISVVLLTKRQGPAVLHGLLTGPGGKVEPGESAEAAVRREFLEETCVDIPDWIPVAELQVSNTAQVFFYAAVSSDYAEVKTRGAEVVGVYRVVALRSLSVVPDGLWLIPFAIEKLCGNTTDRSIRLIP